MGGWRGALATVGVVVAALVGIAVLYEQDRSEPDLDDRSGLIARWGFQPVDRTPLSAVTDSEIRPVFQVGESQFDVYWSARPCAKGPRITVSGTAQRLLVAIDRHDVGACDDSSVGYRLRMTTAVPVRRDAIHATVTA